jgi:hypothetical protein
MSFINGCAQQPLEISSTHQQTTLRPTFTAAIMQEIDENTRDIILTNLPIEQMRSATLDELLDMMGIVIHIHQFFEPKTGSTALDATASNVSVRMVILNGSGFGVYGGGGLFRISESLLSSSSFTGILRGGNVRPMHLDGSFQDVLGPASISGRFEVVTNDSLTQQGVQVVRRLLMHADVQSSTAQ